MAATGDAQERRTHVPASAQGLLFDDDLPELERGHRLPRPDRLPGRRHHLPPARLLGSDRPGRAVRPQRHRLGNAAPLRVPRHPRAQGRQAPARHRRLAAADPRGHPGAARARRRGPRPDHPDERRRHASTSARRPTRSSTCCRAARASSASPSAASGARSRATLAALPERAPRGRGPGGAPRRRAAALAGPSASPDTRGPSRGFVLWTAPTSAPPPHDPAARRHRRW